MKKWWNGGMVKFKSDLLVSIMYDVLPVAQDPNIFPLHFFKLYLFVYMLYIIFWACIHGLITLPQVVGPKNNFSYLYYNLI